MAGLAKYEQLWQKFELKKILTNPEEGIKLLQEWPIHNKSITYAFPHNYL